MSFDSIGLNFAHQHHLDAIDFPRFSKSKDLRQLGAGYYRMVLAQSQSVWGPDVAVVSDVQVPANENEITVSANVESFSHIWVRKLRFGASEEHRGQSAKYGYIDARVPVQIDHLFRVQHEFSADRKISAAFAILRRFQPCTAITDWPWDLWYVYPSCQYIALNSRQGHRHRHPCVEPELFWTTRGCCVGSVDRSFCSCPRYRSRLRAMDYDCL